MPQTNPSPGPSPKYRVSLKLPDKTHTKVADSIMEGLEKLPVPHFWKSKAIIQVEFGKKRAEVYFWPFALRKLFVNKMSKQLLSKRLQLALK
jgi:hypothetical protein